VSVHLTRREAIKQAADDLADDLEELQTAVRKLLALRGEVTTGKHFRPSWDIEVSAAMEKLSELVRE
jgi:hypothetical protein